MDRSDFLRLSAAPLMSPLLPRGDAPEPVARLVYPDGRVVRWAEGTIDAEAAVAMGVTVIRCEDAPRDAAPGCVWAKPSEDLLGVVSNQLWGGADAVAVEDVEGFAIVTVRTPFRIEMEDGSYILSRGRTR